MINDAAPRKEARWVVLVEAETCAGYEEDHRWQLVATHAVPEGGRTAADGLARRIAMEYVPKGVSVGSGDIPARKIFRVADGSWLVEVRGNDHKGVLCRITAAELVREWEYVRAGETPAERRRRVLGQN
ncbi:hypothetical protein ABZW03_28590 [Kitasatospora sp. NPDC004799]|uniref:hypothetical protein n=1 Tax=Kitasatospora sp. NPDC004799 TaxID=3154460 RepID=UPI0033B9EBF9